MGASRDVNYVKELSAIGIIPKDPAKMGYIIAFKKVNARRKETLETAAQAALTQIEEKQCEAELRTLGITNIIKLGISFKGKESLVMVGPINQ